MHWFWFMLGGCTGGVAIWRSWGAETTQALGYAAAAQTLMLIFMCIGILWAIEDKNNND